MRTESMPSLAKATARARGELGRVWRRLAAQPTALRWSLGAAALVALIAVSYAATTTSTAASGAFVRAGERFSSDDLITVTRALDARQLRYEVDRQNRIVVASGRLTEANEAITKLDIGPKSIAEIMKEAAESSPWDAPAVIEQRQAQARNALLERMIGRLDGIVSAMVMIHKAKTRATLRSGPSPNPTGPTALVYLETENHHELSSGTIERIQSLIAGAEPEVKHDAVTVIDWQGRTYLDPHNPALGARARNRARQEELRQEILDRIDWIDGVKVSVQLVSAPVLPMPRTARSRPLPPLPSSTPTPAPVEPPPAPPAEEISAPVKLPPLSMRVNQPVELEAERPPQLLPDPAPDTEPDPTPTPVPVPREPVVDEADLVAESIEPPAKARVWVKVPRSFYLKAVPSREPSLEALQPLVERTRRDIEVAIGHVIPRDQLEEPVQVSIIPDEAPMHAAPPPLASDATEVSLGWMAAGAAMGVTMTLAGVAFRVLAVRRPRPRRLVRTRDSRGRYTLDDVSDSGPGPTERVRELIRLNPEAAASVLHRWTGQGGSVA